MEKGISSILHDLQTGTLMEKERAIDQLPLPLPQQNVGVDDADYLYHKQRKCFKIIYTLFSKKYQNTQTIEKVYSLFVREIEMKKLSESDRRNFVLNFIFDQYSSSLPQITKFIILLRPLIATFNDDEVKNLILDDAVDNISKSTKSLFCEFYSFVIKAFMKAGNQLSDHALDQICTQTVALNILMKKLFKTLKGDDPHILSICTIAPANAVYIDSVFKLDSKYIPEIAIQKIKNCLKSRDSVPANISLSLMNNWKKCLEFDILDVDQLLKSISPSSSNFVPADSKLLCRFFKDILENDILKNKIDDNQLMTFFNVLKKSAPEELIPVCPILLEKVSISEVNVMRFIASEDAVIYFHCWTENLGEIIKRFTNPSYTKYIYRFVKHTLNDEIDFGHNSLQNGKIKRFLHENQADQSLGNNEQNGSSSFDKLYDFTNDGGRVVKISPEKIVCRGWREISSLLFYLQIDDDTIGILLRCLKVHDRALVESISDVLIRIEDDKKIFDFFQKLIEGNSIDKTLFVLIGIRMFRSKKSHLFSDFLNDIFELLQNARFNYIPSTIVCLIIRKFELLGSLVSTSQEREIMSKIRSIILGLEGSYEIKMTFLEFKEKIENCTNFIEETRPSSRNTHPFPLPLPSKRSNPNFYSNVNSNEKSNVNSSVNSNEKSNGNLNGGNSNDLMAADPDNIGNVSTETASGMKSIATIPSHRAFSQPTPLAAVEIGGARTTDNFRRRLSNANKPVIVKPNLSYAVKNKKFSFQPTASGKMVF